MSCEYFQGGRICSNRYFQAWNGSSKIPAPPDEYCSDWYEPAKKSNLVKPDAKIP